MLGLGPSVAGLCPRVQSGEGVAGGLHEAEAAADQRHTYLRSAVRSFEALAAPHLRRAYASTLSPAREARSVQVLAVVWVDPTPCGTNWLTA